MRKAPVILLVAYYIFGTLCLPCSDFSALTDLPGMYRHCKATEDKDMTLLDFLTDHLVNVDGIFDKHDNGDEQKPHNAQPSHHQEITVFCSLVFSDYSFAEPLVREKPAVVYRTNFYRSDYIPNIFRPPIV